jgi:hypothetical protein
MQQAASAAANCCRGAAALVAAAVVLLAAAAAAAAAAVSRHKPRHCSATFKPPKLYEIGVYNTPAAVSSAAQQSTTRKPCHSMQ